MQLVLQLLFAIVVCNCCLQLLLKLLFATVVCICCLQLLLHSLFASVVTIVVCSCCYNCCLQLLLQLLFATVVCNCCYNYCLQLLFAIETRQSKNNKCLRTCFKTYPRNPPPGHFSKHEEKHLDVGSRGTPPPRAPNGIVRKLLRTPIGSASYTYHWGKK